MESDLNRSVRLLDEAISTTNKGIFRRDVTNPVRKTCDLSIASEAEMIGMQSFLKENSRVMLDETFRSFLDENKTLTGSIIRTADPWRNTADNLYLEFFEILQSNGECNDALNVVAEMSRCCTDSLNVIKGMKSKVVVSNFNEDAWLENERNTWRLLYVLYGNRLNSTENNQDEIINYYGQSEKFCMLALFKKDSLVREIQLAIDWLECNAAQKDDEVLHFSDSTMGWENTLHQLKSKDTIVFQSSRPVVKTMDPDAPHYQELSLHDLDLEDEKKLCKKVFTEIRCGKLGEAQKLCGYCGHSWRAAILEGWKLYHNPKLQDDFTDEYKDVEYNQSGDSPEVAVEGNESRDIWKDTAWLYCSNPNLDKYEKAAVGAYCGHLKSLINVCSSWEDYLWAYLRVMMDIRVESEIRENVMRDYSAMPAEYWEQKMSVNEIFTYLEALKDAQVHDEALNPDHVIQKYVILDEIDKLLELIDNWATDPTVSPQFLRFLSHFLLFFEQIGQINNRDVIEKVIEEYIKRLIEMKHTHLIAYYVSKLNESMQVHIYSMYLEGIIDNKERYESLKIAEDCGLNIHKISKQVVEHICSRHEVSQNTDLQQKISKLDEFKIASLDWLLFEDSQLPETLKQTNALIFQFLTLKKLDAAQLTFNKLPSNVVQRLSEDEHARERVEQDIRDHLSYKSYLDAQEAFNVWFEHHRARPSPPVSPGENAAFPEKVAFEHKTSQYKAEMSRWKLTIGELSKLAKTALYNILLFPDGGWLHGAKDADYLRSVCIPECALLLYTVLYESELFAECVQLADIVVSENHKLYEVYSSEHLGKLFVKLSEASVALLNRKKDPWGHEMSA